MMKNTIESVLNESVTGTVSGTGRIVTESGREYFLKSGAPGRAYRCEANGLQELKRAEAVRTPRIIAVGEDYLLTEYIAPGSRPAGFFAGFGRKLAQLHRFRATQYGFYENNFIGATPQMNIPSEAEKTAWPVFFLAKRLLPQYELAVRNGFVTPALEARFRRLETMVGEILGDSDEPPVLLHGDLWAGNFLCDGRGEPVLIDPAVYYGHREADLAMTRLFGGFPSEFYEAYERHYPLAEGWQYREKLYRLYHVLNHLNLFGTGYLSEAVSLIDYYAKG